MRTSGIGSISQPSGLKYVADAAALAALTNLNDGELVLQVDTNELFSWDAGGSTFVFIGSSTSITVSDTTSMDLTLTGSVLTADVLPAGIDHDSLNNTHNLSTDIDHDALTNTHDLTTDIDHSSITNTHDLTTDIDHDSITNTHNLTTDIDHDALTNTHNLSTDIDHDGLTNTHNLTTDIDHDALTNFASNEHIDWTNASDNITTSGYIKTTGNIVADSVKAVTAASCSTVFTGAGLDDIVVDCTDYTGTGCSIRVSVIGVGSPDNFRLIMGTNGTNLISSQNMTASPVDVFHGVKINWASATGHTNGNYWTITLVGSGTTFTRASGAVSFKISDGTIKDTNIFFGKTPEDNSLLIQNLAAGTWEELKRYALRQLIDGTTYLNVITGKALEFVEGGVRVMRLIGGKLGIGVTTPSGQFHVKQASTTAAIPVVVLEQADEDRSFIDYKGTSAADAVASVSSYTTGNNIQGFVQIKINDTKYWMPYYNDPTS